MLSGFSSKLNVTIAGITFETWQVAAIVFLLFLLVIVMASVRRHFMEFTVKGAGFGIALGFLLAIVMEGLLLVGGRTFLIETLGWKNAPKPIQKTVDNARSRFISVLGASQETLDNVTPSTAEKIMSEYQSLSPEEASKLRFRICTP